MSYMAARSVRALKGGIAILVVALLGVAMILLVNSVVPQENQNLVSMIVGGLIANSTTIVSNLFPNTPGRAGTKAGDP